MEKTLQLDRITGFLAGIGFHVVRDIKPRTSFIPGVFINGMTICVDPTSLASPGDILHDAGHQAIIPSMFRPRVSGDISKSFGPLADEYFDTHNFLVDDNGTEDFTYRALLQVGENEAQAWSFAAAIAAEIPLRSVFHDGAYNGDGATIEVMMRINSHFGINGLQAAKMTRVVDFPKMIRWLQV